MLPFSVFSLLVAVACRFLLLVAKSITKPSRATPGRLGLNSKTGNVYRVVRMLKTTGRLVQS